MLRVNITTFKILSCALLIIVLQAVSTDHVWPKPINMTVDPKLIATLVNPCQITYIIDASIKAFAQELIEYYQVSIFKCTSIKPGKISLYVAIKNVDVLIPTEVKHERYTLNLYEDYKWELIVDYYPGFLRGFETYSQLFELNNIGKYQIIGLPIKIIDQPSFKWRGIMIDTSRHYLPVSTIKKAIDAMLFSKLNVLHWHIIDQDAFPMQIPNVPELSQHGKIGGTYSPSDIKSIIAYARGRGVRVIPEIDTPAHTQSWGRSEKYRQIVVKCDHKYDGQLDPTLNLTWQIVTEIMKYVNEAFIDDYVHFGGDQVTYICWGLRIKIIEWMQKHRIRDFKHLSIYFRQKQKQIWRSSISSKKKIIYWANQQIDLPLQDDDIIQWWGVSTEVKKMVGRKNQVILSNYDLTYLDKGFGDTHGSKYGQYLNWRKIYAFQPRVEHVNVIGGQSCMWNEIGTKHTFEQKVLQRANVIGERLWNLKNIATRLTAHSERLRNRGFKVWPVTVGLCQQQMDICFN